jgi:hypothetical protein
MASSSYKPNGSMYPTAQQMHIMGFLELRQVDLGMARKVII